MKKKKQKKQKKADIEAAISKARALAEGHKIQQLTSQSGSKGGRLKYPTIVKNVMVVVAKIGVWRY